jgi:hypothetical protein
VVCIFANAKYLPTHPKPGSMTYVDSVVITVKDQEDEETSADEVRGEDSKGFLCLRHLIQKYPSFLNITTHDCHPDKVNRQLSLVMQCKSRS